MKHYLVTLTPSDPVRLDALNKLLRGRFGLWSCEFDEGLFFISSAEAPSEIHHAISEQIEIELGDSLYVFELGETFYGGGTTDVRRSIGERLSEF